MNKKTSLLSSILIMGYPAFASINNNYHMVKQQLLMKNQLYFLLQVNPITLKPEINAINPNDPLIKTLI
ncbi:MAG: hypothetical protein PHC75_08870 [Burkholderiales bacterium]|nr:hypothetical protein [Burkholderiales bacterium]